MFSRALIIQLVKKYSLDLEKKSTIRPAQPLADETVYQLVISDQLTAKSGAQLPAAVTVSFTTAAEAVQSGEAASAGEQPPIAQETPALAPAVENPPPAAPAVSVAEPAVEEQPAAQPVPENTPEPAPPENNAAEPPGEEQTDNGGAQEEDTAAAAVIASDDSGEQETEALPAAENPAPVYAIIGLGAVLCLGAAGFYIMKRKRK